MSSSSSSLALDSEPVLPSHLSTVVSSPPPSIAPGCPDRPVNIMSKGRGRTLSYLSSAQAGGSLVLGGLSAASCKMMGGAGWRVTVGSSLDGGFCWLVGEACTREACNRKIAPGTTRVACTMAFPVRASWDPRPGDARRRWRYRSLGEAAAIGHDIPGSPMDPDFP